MSAARRERVRSGTKVEHGWLQNGWRTWRARVAWGVVVLGAALFVAGNIGARAGITILPFDPHHVYAQFGGAALAIIALVWATGDRR
ncbi:MAG: hypothetical protein ACRDJ5_07535 [Actinomycetota bacterium]